MREPARFGKHIAQRAAKTHTVADNREGALLVLRLEVTQ